MKKCKTCKHYTPQGFKMGRCSGIRPETLVIPIPNQPKGKPNAKLVSVRHGIITDASFIMTTEDWYCKNWTRKQL